MKEKQITFRDLMWSDRSYFYNWIQDEEIIKYSLSIFQNLNSNNEIDQWFRTVVENKKSFCKAILYDNILIGYAGIVSISKVNNSGEYFIFIGDRTRWGKGAATFVTKYFINIAFEELLLNRLSLTVSDENVYAVKAYRKAGFLEEGQMRKACFRESSYHDKIMMSIIKDDFELLNK